MFGVSLLTTSVNLFHWGVRFEIHSFPVLMKVDTCNDKLLNHLMCSLILLHCLLTIGTWLQLLNSMNICHDLKFVSSDKYWLHLFGWFYDLFLLHKCNGYVKVQSNKTNQSHHLLNLHLFSKKLLSLRKHIRKGFSLSKYIGVIIFINNKTTVWRASMKMQ